MAARVREKTFTLYYFSRPNRRGDQSSLLSIAQFPEDSQRKWHDSEMSSVQMHICAMSANEDAQDVDSFERV